MGNYMETCIQRNRNVRKQPQQQGQQDESAGKRSDTFSKESSTPSRRVKLVLRKDELERLLVQLKKDEGRTLEVVLGEIVKSRILGVDQESSSVTKWKPGLESIMELEPLDSSS